MGTKIKINPIAADDLKEIKDYIAEESIDMAVKVVKEILEKIEGLSVFPEMGISLQKKIKLKSKYRYLICGQYLIFYIYKNEVVYVQRVLHGKRDYIMLLKQ